MQAYIQSQPEEFNTNMEKLIQKHTHTNALFYICGSQRFVNGSISLLEHHGIDENRIKLESFNKKKKDTTNTDTNTNTVS